MTAKEPCPINSLSSYRFRLGGRLLGIEDSEAHAALAIPTAAGASREGDVGADVDEEEDAAVDAEESAEQEDDCGSRSGTAHAAECDTTAAAAARWVNLAAPGVGDVVRRQPTVALGIGDVDRRQPTTNVGDMARNAEPRLAGTAIALPGWVQKKQNKQKTKN